MQYNNIILNLIDHDVEFLGVKINPQVLSMIFSALKLHMFIGDFPFELWTQVRAWLTRNCGRQGLFAKNGHAHLGQDQRETAELYDQPSDIP